MEWEAVIGLEVHAQLKTKSKIFSGASTEYGAAPNTQACAIDLAFPGMLPVLNEEAVNMAIKFGIAANAKVCKHSVFARKNYFYPDLPKGYQISQHIYPIVQNGFLDIPVEGDMTKRIGITRAHLEEDSGKSLHEDFHGMTGLDLNRAGITLLEIVSEPDIRTPQEASTYVKILRSLVRYLEICDGNMQEGSMRVDVNVSVRPKGETKFGTRAEIKNLNSFKFIEKAILYEAERQISIITNGGKIIQETRLYDPAKNETRSMRAKEESNDYRYFPEPDLLPLELTDDMIEAIRNNMPELPHQKRDRFINEYKLSQYEADLLVTNRDLGNYFEAALKQCNAEPKLVANWILGDLSAVLNKTETDISDCPIEPERFAQLICRINDKTISGNIAKTIFETLWHEDITVDEIIEQKGLKQVTDSSAIEEMIKQVIIDNPKEYERYKNGETKLFGFFVGQAMKASKGKANPQQLNEILKKLLA